MASLEPTARSICDADISSSQDYLDWWAKFDEELRAHRREVIDVLVSAVGAAIWDPVLRRDYLQWISPEPRGWKIHRQKQVDLADYRVWMRGMCA